jgi:type IV pilus assembly protein PilB
MLLQQGKIDPIQLTSALAYQRRWGCRIGHALVALGFVSEPEVLKTVGKQLDVPVVTIGDKVVLPYILNLLPEKLIRSRHAFPMALLSEAPGGPLLVAMSEPENLLVINELSFAAGMEIIPALASNLDIDQAIARHFGKSPSKDLFEHMELPVAIEEETEA